ncbi:MAG TPA: IS6 family transposase [Ochrobactrum intermedium]|uniref:IS6 family transposase n=1 Tax=Brucella intermedia TaxID=94625 RepID=A0A7V6PCS0_9HYPH|nr:IS6 family transposase [Brucella intermedia]
MHATYKDEWTYLYRAIDISGDIVECYFSRNRDLQAAKRFLCEALNLDSRSERIAIDAGQPTVWALCSV